MKKIKLIAVLLAVVLAAGMGIFSACTKDNQNMVNNLTKETGFVARINKSMCVQVDISRDKNNNVHIITERVADDPELPTMAIIAETLKLAPQQSKDNECIEIEIPNDAIYWLVPLDGNEPIKFEPVVSDAKSGFGAVVTYSCTCTEGKPNCLYNIYCPAPVKKESPYGSYLVCLPGSESCCKTCNLITSVPLGGGPASIAESFITGSSYIVKSDTIVVNGVTYE